MSAAFDQATQQAATSCIALGYRYGSLLDCVRDQCPGLLSDPELSQLAAKADAAKAAFAARLKLMAEQPYDQG
ncbi:MAG: hypothetical protein IIZ92_25850 [Aquincola sp.]|nr:hypothetical protein [Aquincola sp.]